MNLFGLELQPVEKGPAGIFICMLLDMFIPNFSQSSQVEGAHGGHKVHFPVRAKPMPIGCSGLGKFQGPHAWGHMPGPIGDPGG